MCETCTYMWRLDDEYSCCQFEPPRPLSVCEGIDDNSTWGEPILTNNCSTLLNANMSQVTNGQMDLMCVCVNSGKLGTWL